jgi:hypothetical protein
MKTVAIVMSVAFQVASSAAWAQGRSDQPTTPARPAPAGGNWIVSETTSPVDYKPIITASTNARDGSKGSAMQLSIQCRGGRTELWVLGPAVSRSSAEYAISYRINDGQPVQLAAGAPSSGTGAAFTGDVVRLLQSLPEEGDIAVRLSTRTGAAQDGNFLLDGLKIVREKVAAACKWPHTVAKPRN